MKSRVVLLLSVTVLFATACGVRNDPIPPKDFPQEEATLSGDGS